MNITVSVMAHPKRRKQALALHKKLIQYPFSHVRIILDEKNEEWDTGYRSIASGAGKGDWHLVLQDDALLTPNFYENVEGAISAIPERVMFSLYVGTVKPMRDEITMAVSKAYFATWLKHYMLFWGVGVAIPTDQIEPLLEFVSDQQFAETLYDTRIGMFYQRNRLPVYYTMPSLVDHDDSAGSIIGTDAKEPRVAHRLATGLVQWNKQAIDI